jgi:uncharacterized protein (DUF1684 family)
VVVTAGTACGPGDEPVATATTPQDVDDAYVEQIEADRAEREAGLADEEGWLSLVALHFPFAPGDTTLGSSADSDIVLPDGTPARLGTVRREGDDLTFTPASPASPASPESGARVVHLVSAEDEDADPIEEPVTGPISLAPDTSGDATVLGVGSVTFYAIERGGELGLRVKDRQAPSLAAFEGLDYYPLDPALRVEARLVRDAEPTTVAVPNVLGQVSEEPSSGRLVFELEGQELSLRPIDSGGTFFIVFGDRTNGRGSYGGGRFLGAEMPDPQAPDAPVILDFNRAENPPCAFSPHATCPLPPAENKLPAAIEAGERAYTGPGGH